MTIDAARLDSVTALAMGSHADHRAMCVMEAVAYVAGEPWSDRPRCACPVLTSFAIRLNDRITNDAERTRIMRPLIPLLVETRTDSRAIMVKRAYVAADFAARESMPRLLDALGKADVAAQCRTLAPVTDRDTARAAEGLLREVRAAADAAAADAAYAAAYAADADAAAYADAAAADAAYAAAYAAAAYADAAAADAAAADAAYAYADAAAAYADAAAYAAKRKGFTPPELLAIRVPYWEAAARCLERMCQVTS